MRASSSKKLGKRWWLQRRRLLLSALMKKTGGSLAPDRDQWHRSGADISRRSPRLTRFVRELRFWPSSQTIHLVSSTIGRVFFFSSSFSIVCLIFISFTLILSLYAVSSQLRGPRASSNTNTNAQAKSGMSQRIHRVWLNHLAVTDAQTYTDVRAKSADLAFLEELDWTSSARRVDKARTLSLSLSVQLALISVSYTFSTSTSYLCIYLDQSLSQTHTLI